MSELPRPRTRVVVLASLLASCIALVAALGIGELAVRLLRPQQLIQPRPDIFIPADTVGWDLRPDVLTTVNTGERNVTWRTDAEGFRIGTAGRVEQPNELLLIGDSFMQAMQVDWEQSAAGILDTRLRAAGHAIAVRNSGVSAWDPPQYAARLRRALAHRRPAAVIVSWYVGNDATGDAPAVRPARAVMTSAKLSWPRTASWPDIVQAWLRPMNDLLKQHSHLFVLARQALLGARMRAGLAADAAPTEILVREASSTRWERSAAWGDTLARIAQTAGVPIGFVLIPSTYQVHDQALALYAQGNGFTRDQVDLAQPNTRMAAALASSGVPIVDALPSFRQASTTSRELLYGTVDRHLSPAGNALFALVLDSLARQLLPMSSTTAGPERP